MRRAPFKYTNKATRPNTNVQSYQHMMGQITDPKDHPAYNVPDPAAGAYGPANPPSAPLQDASEFQDVY